MKRQILSVAARVRVICSANLHSHRNTQACPAASQAGKDVKEETTGIPPLLGFLAVSQAKACALPRRSPWLRSWLSSQFGPSLANGAEAITVPVERILQVMALEWGPLAVEGV